MNYPMYHLMHRQSRSTLIRPWLTGGLLALFLWLGLWSLPVRLAAQQDPQAVAVLGSITGRVTDDTGTPLANIVVTLYKASYYGGYDATTTVTTDGAGVYRFSFVPTGTYRLGFRDLTERVAPLYYPNAEQIEYADDLPITGHHLTQPPVTLVRTGSITGLVTTFSGEVGRISTVTLSRDNQTLLPWDYGFTQTPTAQGMTYTLRGLRPGFYRLGLTVTLPNGDSYEEYYADALTAVAAALIPLAANQTVEAINFQMGENPKLANLTGQVVDSTTGQPIPGLRVTAYVPAGSDIAWLARSTTTDGNGVYHLRTLNPGLYKIGFSDPTRRYADRYYPQRNRATDALPIELNAGATTNLATEPLPLAGKIIGQVTLFDGAKPAGRLVQLFADNVDVPTVVAEDHLGADEDFAFDHLAPGVYRLRASATDKGIVFAEYFQGAFTLRDAQPITVTAGGQVQVAPFTLGQRTAYGAIAGHLQDATNTPLAGVTAAAWIWNADTWQPLGSTQTDTAGNYVLAPLQPGTYRVCFEAADQQVIATCFQSSPNQAAPIRVLAGETTGNINATLTRTGSITGTITFLPNPPLVSALTVYKQVGAAWLPVRDVAVQRTTEERFAYLLAGLETGIYRLKLAGYDFTQYYGGVTDLTSATDIAVRFGEATPAIDFVIGQDTQHARIEGSVTVGGVAQAGIQVELYHSTCCDYWQRLVYVTTDATGRYTIDGLASGSYRLAFVDPNHLLPTLYLGAPRPVAPNTAIDIRDASTLAIHDPRAVLQIQVDMQSGEQRFPRPFFLPLIMR